MHQTILKRQLVCFFFPSFPGENKSPPRLCGAFESLDSLSRSDRIDAVTLDSGE